MSTGRAIRSPAPVDTHFGHNLSFAKFHLYRCPRAIKWEKSTGTVGLLALQSILLKEKTVNLSFAKFQ